MKLSTRKYQKGFTLIELLVVMGILAVLLAITIIAINPARQFAQANDAKRVNDVGEVLNAIGEYSSDNKGALPTGLTNANCPPTTPCPISSTSTGGNICGAIMPTYIASFPSDPSNTGGSNITDCTTYNSGYTVSVDTNNRVTVYAPEGQINTNISATR